MYIYIYACIPGISKRGGHCIRILYIGTPLHKNSRCGGAIDYYSLYGQAICIYIYMHTYVYKESL